MTDDTQPEAMDLADWLEAVGGGPSAKRCAALLREQHARIAELESELEAVGAGGVQALSAAPAEQQAAPKAAPGVGNSGFDHKTAADLLNGKTVSDEAVRKFVAASRWAHDERAALSATLLAMHGVLASREAEIALLKKALLEAEAAPKAAPGEPTPELQRMTASRAAFFMERFLREEKLLGPNERAAVQFALNMLEAAPQQEAQEPTEIPEEIERMAADRYKVVPSHESMFHRWAVVAGTGTQQLHLGREVECQNMARKFAGAFLDGAFVTMQSTSPNPAPAPLSDDVVKDAARWRMAALIGNEVMLPPDKRTHATAVKAYMDATHSGSDLTGAVDAALAAQGGKA